MSERFSRNEGGVSEVLGFTLGFLMSFALLMIALYAFRIVADPANELAAEAQMEDVSNRVAAGVLEMADIAGQRAGSSSTVNSTELLYRKTLVVPAYVRGEQYRLTLASGEITATSLSGTYTARATSFNLRAGTPCSYTQAVCSLSGSVLSSGSILIKYEYKASGTSTTCSTSPVNCITIS